MDQLMKQAQRMQQELENAQAEAAEFTGEAEVGGGMVKVVVNADHQVVSLTIKPEVVDPEDLDMLQDLIIAAVNEANRVLDEKTNAHMGKFTGGLGGFGF